MRVSFFEVLFFFLVRVLARHKDSDRLVTVLMSTRLEKENTRLLRKLYNASSLTTRKVYTIRLVGWLVGWMGLTNLLKMSKIQLLRMMLNRQI